MVVYSSEKWWKVGDYVSIESKLPYFIGEHSHNIDKKGRIIIPAKFREYLSEIIYVTRGLDGCLKIYTDEQFKKLAAQIYQMPSTKKEAREYQRFFLSSAADCEIDGQGRILIPANLIKSACLIKECVVIGCGNTIEIWSKERWDAYNELHNDDIEEVAESLTEFLI